MDDTGACAELRCVATGLTDADGDVVDVEYRWAVNTEPRGSGARTPVPSGGSSRRAPGPSEHPQAIHDFNLMPQHRYPPNPILALAFKTGLRKNSHRDYRCLQQWRSYSEQCSKK